MNFLKKHPNGPNEKIWIYFEWVFWPTLLFGTALLTATTDFIRDTRGGADLSFWQPFFRELISSLVILTLIPAIIYIVQKFSWRKIGLPSYIALHLALSIPFTFIHIMGTIVLRMSGSLLSGASLNWEYIIANFKFEYPKDLIAYGLFIILINTYTWIRRSIGQKDKVRIEAGTIPVKTLSGIAMIKLPDVEWVEAAKNYVVLHSKGKEYFLRTPIKEVEQDLRSHGFLRIHRSAIANFSMIKEIRKAPPRDAVAVLITGKKIKIGRQYKGSLEKSLRLKK